MKTIAKFIVNIYKALCFIAWAEHCVSRDLINGGFDSITFSISLNLSIRYSFVEMELKLYKTT